MRTRVDWRIKPSANDLDRAILAYGRYLEAQGLRESTRQGYEECLKRYLVYCGESRPPTTKVAEFRDMMLDKHLSRSSMNNSGFALKKFYQMLGEQVVIPFLKPSSHLPDYFREDEIQRIFDATGNLKHLAMLNVLFYGCLRASELCALNVEDVDTGRMVITVREGKGGRDGLAYINEEAIRVLKSYLDRRPPLEIDGRQPLFYTDHGQRFDRKMLSKIFNKIKDRAGIERRGSVHVFGRHSPATLLVAKGCDIRIVQTLLRHKNIATTTRYTHVSDQTARNWYEKCLRFDP